MNAFLKTTRSDIVITMTVREFALIRSALKAYQKLAWLSDTEAISYTESVAVKDLLEVEY